MVNIRHALGSLPSRPVLVIAPVLAALALGYHYYTVYRSCTDQSALRERVMAAVANDAEPNIHLSEATPFAWSSMRIFREHEPGRSARDCPMGWGWSTAKRNRLAAEGLLTVIGFYANDTMVGFVELSGEDIRFTGARTTFDADDAVFTVGRPKADDAPFLLTAAE